GLNKSKTQASHHVYKFAERNSLELNKDYSKKELYRFAVKFSSEKARNRALDVLEGVVEVINNVCLKLDVLRKESYKRVCGIFHPDNRDTGSEESFKFIQEVKEAFWDYKGKPRKKVDPTNWEMEKRIDNESVYDFMNF
ncbi:MAG: hypothetical protein ACRC5T_05445, partial [Cetobacterium sp.]